MRIIQKPRQARWEQTWRNIASPFLPATVCSEWYRVVHDIVPTNDRMHKIGLMDTDLCTTSRTTDTLEHKLTRCNISKTIWAWLAGTLATICRRHPATTSGMMLLRPDFYFYPPQRQRAVIWLVGHTVYYIITRKNMTSLEDYVEFLKRTRWKT
jgi:hypothetical protein